MEASLTRTNQIVQVRGFADQNLRDKEHPESPSNRRISVIVKYQQGVADVPDTPEGGEKPAKAEH